MNERSSIEIVFTGKNDNYFVNQRPLAFGRASVLWLGNDSSGVSVCIKAFRDAAVPDVNLSEFINELIARQDLNHPHILPVLDYGHDRQTGVVPEPFIVLPYCAGGNLKKLLRGRDYLNPEIFFPILEQISSAVDFAHINGIIHGDIKPENILFQDEDKTHVFLADFGAANFFPIAEEFSTLVSVGAGTTAYLSPEQIEDNLQSPSSDIYALAMVAYEALTGRFPFPISAAPFRQMLAKVQGRILDPREANNRLHTTISEALVLGLSTSPSKRPESAKKLCQLMKGEMPNSDINVLQKSQIVEAYPPHEYHIKLIGIFTDRFNEEELRDFCHYLKDVDYENLPGNSKSEKTRELINYLKRRNRVEELVELGNKLRPDIKWDR
jgi:eukaryotic-like serine/threonine-protein kinase